MSPTVKDLLTGTAEDDAKTSFISSLINKSNINKTKNTLFLSSSSSSLSLSSCLSSTTFFCSSCLSLFSSPTTSLSSFELSLSSIAGALGCTFLLFSLFCCYINLKYQNKFLFFFKKMN